MPDIFIVVTPAFNSNGKRRHDRYDAHLRDTGELISSATRQPLLDASRELLARGYDPKDVIRKVRSEAPQIVTMRAIIGIAAQYDVMGEKFVRRKAAGPDASHKNRTQVAHSSDRVVATRRQSDAARFPRHLKPRRAASGIKRSTTVTDNTNKVFPGFAFQRRRHVELEANLLLAGQLIVDIPRALKEKRGHRRMVEDIVQTLVEHRRSGIMPDDAMVYGWRDGKRPANAVDVKNDEIMKAWVDRSLIIALRVDDDRRDYVVADSDLMRQLEMKDH